MQAFLLYTPDFCADDGEIALLAPTKSTILVSRNTHKTFRRRFFNRYTVEAVINFSALRHELFTEATHPATAVLYRPNPPQPNRRIAYGIPKPSPLSRQLGAIVLDANEVKFLDREELSTYPVLWKVALWGNSRDAALIERLKSLPTLQDQAKKLGWKVREGIQVGGGKENLAPWLEGMPLLPTRKFRRYAPDMDSYTSIQAEVFHSPRDRDIVRGPLVLIRHSPIGGRCAAAFSKDDVAYRDSISGVAGHPGQEDLLKLLTAYINSPLAQYYQFLTSTRWGVERDPILHQEYKYMPFLLPDEDDPRLKQIVDHFDQIVDLMQQGDILVSFSKEGIQRHEAAIAELIFDLYDLTSTERQLIHDLVDYGIHFFYWSQGKRQRQENVSPIQPPGPEMLKAYADTFVETVTELLRYQDRTLNALVYENGTPLSAVAFELVDLADVSGTQIMESPDALREILRRLDRHLLEQRTRTLYMRRHVRIYDGPWLYLVRPSERRFWTLSQAYADADDIVVEWLSTQQENQG